jgi:hypothetical protein
VLREAFFRVSVQILAEVDKRTGDRVDRGGDPFPGRLGSARVR